MTISDKTKNRVSGTVALLGIGAMMAGASFMAEELSTRQTITARFQQASMDCEKRALDGGHPVCLKRIFTDKGTLDLWDRVDMPVTDTLLKGTNYTFWTRGTGKIGARTIAQIGTEPSL